MGKSFNDDVFNNDFDIANINGLNISQEAIEENKEKEKPKINLKELGLDDIDKLKEKYKRKQKSQEINQSDYKEILQEEKEQKEQAKVLEEIEQKRKEARGKKEPTAKRTMIFKQEYLDIIDGLASINNMQVKDVFNQLLEKGIKELDPKIIEKALKTKKKKKNEEKSIF